MRPIKFRGKRLDNGMWAYGLYLQGGYIPGANKENVKVRHIISDDFYYDVDPATIGQFTGLTDKNGKEIYEGDIVRHYDNGKHYVIVYDAPEFCYQDNEDGFRFLNHPEMCEVVGNVHDNSELLTHGNDKPER